MSTSQHTNVAGTPPPAKPSHIDDEDVVGSGDEEEEEKAALLEKLALLDKQQKEKKARKKAEAERKAREEAEQKAREERAREEKAREEEARKAREEAEKKLREEEAKKAQAEEKAREDARIAARERHAAVRKERERKLREAAAAVVHPKPSSVVHPKPSSVISSFRSEDDDRGEGPSHKRSHSNGPGLNVPDVIINKKKRKASPINVDEMEDNMNADDFMEIRGSCDNCEKRKLRCFPQNRSGPNSACAPCNKSKLGCSWVRKRTNQSKAEKARTVSAVPDSSQIVPDLLRTIIGQNEALLTYNRGILDQMKILNEIIASGPGVEEGEVAQGGVNAGESEVPKDDLLDFGDYVTNP